MLIPIRDENRRRIFPVMTLLIALANFAVFIFQMRQGEAQAFVYRFGAIPWEILHFGELPGLKPDFQTPVPNILTLFTSMFIHGGLIHLLGNMLYLWIFADNVEALTGHIRFVWFYLLSGLIAAMTHVAFSPSSSIPMVGASGAISGVLGAYFIRFPGARIHLLVFLFTVRVPAWIMLGIWFAAQCFTGFYSRSETGGVAWFAHIGGFIAGMVLIGFFEKRRKIMKL